MDGSAAFKHVDAIPIAHGIDASVLTGDLRVTIQKPHDRLASPISQPCVAIQVNLNPVPMHDRLTPIAVVAQQYEQHQKYRSAQGALRPGSTSGWEMKHSQTSDKFFGGIHPD
jgi:hypothetical protein